MGLNSKQGCITVQSFCSLGYETAYSLMKDEIDEGLTKIPTTGIITPDLYKTIKTILEDINNYGNLRANKESRNPTKLELDSIKDFQAIKDLILTKDYNNTLEILHQNKNLLNKTGDNIIETELIEKIKEYIKEYKFENDRCNYCNVAKDAVCTEGVKSGGGCLEAGGSCGCQCVAHNRGGTDCPGEGPSGLNQYGEWGGCQNGGCNINDSTCTGDIEKY